LEDEIGKILIAESDIQDKVSELASAISRDYTEKQLLLVGILKGAFMFMADLCRAITVPVKFDFIAVSSYGSGTKSCGVVRILKDLDTDIQNMDVLLVEDIVDSGLTLNYLYRNLKVRHPASLEICALMRKPEGMRGAPEVKYLGFDIPSEFVVGYGLDFAEKYRNLKDIAVLRR
jgi:hypoxanthine phosphoribosyltransferase